MSKTFSKDDVASHSKPDNLWVIIDEDVYDLTKFQDEHPGRSPFQINRVHATMLIKFAHRWKEEYDPARPS